MATSVNYTINGIQFCLTAGTGHMDGVMVNPDHHNLNDPAVIEGLKLALEFYPAFYNYSYLEEQTQYLTDEYQLKSHLRHISDENLEREIAMLFSLMSQDVLTLTEEINRYGSYLIDERAHRRRQEDRVSKRTDSPKRQGYVYLLNEINGQHFKIGRTNNPKERMKTFGVKLPYQVEFDALIQTPDMYALESELHERFADKRVDGEWFALDAQDVQYIKSLAGAS